MNLTKYIQKLAVLAILPLLAVSTVSFSSINVSALFTPTGLGIVPTNPDSTKPAETSWFIATMKPGESKEFSADIVNNGEKELVVDIYTKDSTQTANGSFSFRNTEEKDTGVGTWATLPINQVNVKPNSLYTLKYTVKVPDGIKPGEYSGVIAVNEKPEDAKGAVKVVSRVGARIYITVPGELNSAIETTDFNFMQPGAKNYPAYVKSRPNQPFDDVNIGFNLENTGNVYSKIKGDIKLTTPKGEKTIGLDRDLAPGAAPIFATVTSPDTKWQVGKYKAVFEYQVTALNKIDAKDATKNKKVETEFTMTQAILDQMKSDAASASKPVVGGIKSETSNSNDFSVVDNTGGKTESSDVNKTEAKKDNTAIYIGLGVLGVVLIAGGIIAFIIFKKKKEKKDEEKKPEMNKTETK